MINVFVFIFSKVIRKNNTGNVELFKGVIRFAIKLLANKLAPSYFYLVKAAPLRQSTTVGDPLVIVSLTTFPKRIQKVWLVIETILRQDTKPDKIILWLSEEQFESINSLPNNLLKLQKKGLEIRFVAGDLRSHKKYFYALKEYPKDLIITVDDDIFYPSYMISELMKLHKDNPEVIVCFRGREILLEKEGGVKSYKDWGDLLVKDIRLPSRDIFYTSGGGTLFASKHFDEEVLNDHVFMEYCKFADDVWLNLMSQFKSTKVLKTELNFEILPILIDDNIELSERNLGEDLNDTQLNNVMKYYDYRFYN